MAVYLLLDDVSFIVMMLYADYVVMIVLAVIIGIVFSGLNSAWGDMANKKVADYPRASATGTSIFIAAAGIAQFLSPFVLSGLAGVAGQTQANPFYQYYPAIAILAVGGVILLVMAIVKKNKIDYEREEPAFEGVEEDALASAEA